MSDQNNGHGRKNYAVPNSLESQLVPVRWSRIVKRLAGNNQNRPDESPRHVDGGQK